LLALVIKKAHGELGKRTGERRLVTKSEQGMA